MNEQVMKILENYKDGVPVKVERSTFVWLAATAVLTVAVSAMIVKIIKKM